MTITPDGSLEVQGTYASVGIADIYSAGNTYQILNFSNSWREYSVQIKGICLWLLY